MNRDGNKENNLAAKVADKLLFYQPNFLKIVELKELFIYIFKKMNNKKGVKQHIIKKLI